MRLWQGEYSELKLTVCSGSPLAARERIPNAARTSRLVILTLIHKLSDALVVAKHFVVEVEADYRGAETAPDAIAGSGIDLVMRQRPDIARWSRGPKAAGVRARNQDRRNVTVLEDARAIVGEAHAGGEPLVVVGGADSPGVGRLVDGAWPIEAGRKAFFLRSGVSVVSVDAESAQKAGHEAEVLLVAGLKAIEICVLAIDCHGNCVAREVRYHCQFGGRNGTRRKIRKVKAARDGSWKLSITRPL